MFMIAIITKPESIVLFFAKVVRSRLLVVVLFEAVYHEDVSAI